MPSILVEVGSIQIETWYVHTWILMNTHLDCTLWALQKLGVRREPQLHYVVTISAG